MVRAPFYDENGLKKGAWSAEEDSRLRAYIEKNGLCNWRELPRFAGLSRCGKSCRLRWMNYLRPDVKRGNYSKEEEDIIIKLHKKHGNKWSTIAAELPGRTDNEIKNYWHTRIKKLQKTKVIRRQHGEASNSKTSRTRASETRINLAAETPHSILESFPLSPLTSEYSNVSTDQEFAPSIDMVAQDSPAPTSSFEALDGDFWAQPFVPDSLDVQTEYPMWFTDGGFAPAAYTFVHCDAEDLLYQAMKELPENYQF